jgi:hypothetical protein
MQFLHMVVQLVEALCYECRWRFKSRWGKFFFLIYLILPTALWPCGWLSFYEKWVPRIFLGGKGRPALKADNLTAICEPTVYSSVSQPPGHGSVQGPGINYTRHSSYRKKNLLGCSMTKVKNQWSTKNVEASTSHNPMGLHGLLQA